MPTDVEDKNNTQSSGNCCSSTPNSKRPIDSNTTHTHKIQTNILRLNTLETSAQMCIDERPDRKKKKRMAPSPKSSFLRTPNFCTEHKTTKIKTNRIWVGNMREKPGNTTCRPTHRDSPSVHEVLRFARGFPRISFDVLRIS